tara:strand:- start:778 stop:1209 length:432 start_codon:yes stop_codon:yes gene_type:complete
MGQSTWAAADTTWADNPYTWGISTYQVTANMTQVNLSSAGSEDLEQALVATLGGNYGMAGTTAHVMPAAIQIDGSNAIVNSQVAKMLSAGTLAIGNTIKNNVNFEESGTMGMTGSTSSDNTFLWNDVTEDEDTLWTKISDPDE